MKVAVVDYGMGNLGSVTRALIELGATPFIASTPETLAEAGRIVLPGVGSFHDGMIRLRAGGWVEALQQAVDKGTPLLGICLGMQLLATQGTEGGSCNGLNLLPGRILRLDQLACQQRIPHVGWNNLAFPGDPGPLFTGIPAGTDFYFVHSFAFAPMQTSQVNAVTDYGCPIVAAVSQGLVFGIQFHPEKSSKAGIQLLRNFLSPLTC